VRRRTRTVRLPKYCCLQPLAHGLSALGHQIADLPSLPPKHIRYELGLKTAAFFGSAALGTALHQALAQVYRDWHYLSRYLNWTGFTTVGTSTQSLSPAQAQEGTEFRKYYHNFIAGEVALRRPLAFEGKIQLIASGKLGV